MVNAVMDTIDIGDRKQLFIDERFIAASRGVRLTMNRPAKAGPCLVPLHNEIERDGCLYSTILEVDGEYRMYYSIQMVDEGIVRPDKYTKGVCLALSEDGVNWTRKSLGIYEIHGTKDNNVVLSGVECGTVFLDPRETDGCRFWYFGHRLESSCLAREDEKGVAYTGNYEIDGKSYNEGAFYLMKSEDGLRWTMLPDPVLPFACDSSNHCFYDRRIGKYVAYLRGWAPKDYKYYDGVNGWTDYADYPNWRRVVCRAETSDLTETPWPFRRNSGRPTAPRYGMYGALMDELPVVLRTDESDPDPCDLQTSSVHQYEYADDVYLAFPCFYRYYDGFTSHGRDHRGTRSNDGPLEMQLAVSRDGVNFERFREPYVGLGRIGEMDGGHLFGGIGMIRRGDDLYQYYMASPDTHNGPEIQREPYKPRRIMRVVQRLDGFVSADVGPEGGSITTPLIEFEGNRLELNIDCGAAGEAWVEILGEDGKPVEGYGMDEAVSVDRNGVAQEVWWRRGPDVSALAKRPVKLNIKMRSAKLYAFQFVKAGA